ncbi:MAG: hypothetical protein LH614_02065 [Pyrinomonadaceae bacterium]|nr:hypothetical protein [Pyrinomonadaceae bacterium]
MPKVREKISQCPSSVQAILNSANSMPPGFSDLFAELVQPKGIEKQRKRFYEIVAALPNGFIKNNDWLQSILNNETVSPEAALKEKRGQIYEIVSRMPPEKFAEKFFRNTWREFLLNPNGILHIIAPYLMLSNAIQTAKIARHGLTFVVRMNARKARLLEKEVVEHSLLIINEGVIQVFTEYPLDILINEKIDTRRIKQCRNCKNFFWVKRQNKNVENKNCEKCSNALRQRQFVNKNKDEINRQKRANRYYKKGIPYCEKCVYPNTKCDCYIQERSKKNATT